MTRVELEYLSKNQKKGSPFRMEGQIYFSGIGKFWVESNNDPQKTVSLSMISNLGVPRNIRKIVQLLPGESFTIVRPSASLIISNTENS